MIPTKEQFTELHNALNSNVEFIKDRLDCWQSHPEKTKSELSEIFSKGLKLLKSSTEEEIKEFLNLELQKHIKPDVETYLIKLEASQELPAWIWLNSQQNFIRARERIFKHWPTKEHSGNGLEKFISKITVEQFFRRWHERNEFISIGVPVDAKPWQTWLVESSPIRIFESALRNYSIKISVRYPQWVSGVAIALSNYHYGEAAEMAVTRKNRVEALIAAWESFSEHISLAQSDVELEEYLSISTQRVYDDRKLMGLREAHKCGALYFIGRKDRTLSERLFIKEMALLHSKLFYKRPSASVIVDLFHIDGMEHTPSERDVQRITKDALVNHDAVRKSVAKGYDIWRQKRE